MATMRSADIRGLHNNTIADITKYGEKLEEVASFKYQIVSMSKDGTTTAAVRIRIAMAVHKQLQFKVGGLQHHQLRPSLLHSHIHPFFGETSQHHNPPTADNKFEEIEKFYEELKHIIVKVPYKDIVKGVWNAQAGPDAYQDCNTINDVLLSWAETNASGKEKEEQALGDDRTHGLM
ncbi:hypothetical protein DPMN_085409 [Dreissena polymorpha]|uniref:Uncharacterized protein n=1 Tax=Dreissena polymorpha TaxID=45954 RepID=A0A9D4BK87_DREPO|nr:hypothetical protein DPMN_085409 [Dreissena polymorpha]